MLAEIANIPSCFSTKLLNLLICLSLSLECLNSLTISMNLLQSSFVVVVTRDASCDLDLSSCLLLLSKKLLIDLMLACRRSLSAFLIIFLALSNLIVVLNLTLPGIIPLVIHQRVNLR